MHYQYFLLAEHSSDSEIEETYTFTHYSPPSTRIVVASKKHWIVVCTAMLLLATFLAIGFGISASQDVPTESNSGFQRKSNSVLGNYSVAAVAADGGTICAQIGR